jgi:uncharacterized membrane protein YraQ (UPF0718 family)
MNRDPALVRAEGRISDRAVVLTVVTFFLLTPPILNIFNLPALIFGIPLLHVYCFAVWLAAVACGGWLATRMAAQDGEPGADGEPPERS